MEDPRRNGQGRTMNLLRRRNQFACELIVQSAMSCLDVDLDESSRPNQGGVPRGSGEASAGMLHALSTFCHQLNFSTLVVGHRFFFCQHGIRFHCSDLSLLLETGDWGCSD